MIWKDYLNPIQSGLFWPSLDWGVASNAPTHPPFLKIYERYRRETYTTD